MIKYKGLLMLILTSFIAGQGLVEVSSGLANKSTTIVIHSVESTPPISIQEKTALASDSIDDTNFATLKTIINNTNNITSSSSHTTRPTPFDPTNFGVNCPLPYEDCTYLGLIRCLPNQAPCTNCWARPKTESNSKNYWRCVRVDSEGNCPKLSGIVNILKDCNKENYPEIEHAVG